MRHTRRLIFSAAVAIAFGCASASPYAAIDRAETAVKNANEELAGRFAPTDLERAQEKLGRAKAAAEDEDRWDEARALAAEAEADAELAAARSQTAKTKRMLDEARQGLDTLESESQR